MPTLTANSEDVFLSLRPVSQFFDNKKGLAKGQIHYDSGHVISFVYANKTIRAKCCASQKREKFFNVEVKTESWNLNATFLLHIFSTRWYTSKNSQQIRLYYIHQGQNVLLWSGLVLLWLYAVLNLYMRSMEVGAERALLFQYISYINKQLIFFQNVMLFYIYT